MKTLKHSKPAVSTPGSGRSPAELVRQSNRWRDNYNPLRHFAIPRVVDMLAAADRSDYAELQLTLRKIEKRYPVLKALKARRLAALEKLDWDIKTMDPLPDGVTVQQAEEQKNYLRSRYELIENLTNAFGELALAEIRGFTILQKHRYSTDDDVAGKKFAGGAATAVRELHWLPQSTWSRAGEYGDWYYNKDSQFGIGQDACATALGDANRIGSTELPRCEFIIREVDTPLYEIALIAFANWTMGRKDFAAFVEIFGLPNAIAIMPPNIPVGKEDEYRSAAEKVADGVSGALPNGADVKFPTSSVRSNAPFKEFCDVQDQDVVLAGTGGLLTMLSMPQGIGAGSSQQHADAFEDIALADARRINETLQRDFDAPELDAQFPGQPHVAYFELCAVQQDDRTQLITDIVALNNARYRVKPEVVEEKTGFELEDQKETNKPAGNSNVKGTPNGSPSPGGDVASGAATRDEGELPNSNSPHST